MTTNRFQKGTRIRGKEFAEVFGVERMDMHVDVSGPAVALILLDRHPHDPPDGCQVFRGERHGGLRWVGMGNWGVVSCYQVSETLLGRQYPISNLFLGKAKPRRSGAGSAFGDGVRWSRPGAVQGSWPPQLGAQGSHCP